MTIQCRVPFNAAMRQKKTQKPLFSYIAVLKILTPISTSVYNGLNFYTCEMLVSSFYDFSCCFVLLRLWRQGMDID
jgi:hypothetical protein